MNVGSYRFNIDALLARIVYRWRGRALALLVLLVGLGSLGSGLVPPIWRGQAHLSITAAPGATIQIDGKSWPRNVYAGRHTLLATLPDGRGSWADIDLQAGQVLTLTLSAGLHAPRERSLPPAAPGTHIDQVYWADGVWRVMSVQDPPPEPADRRRQEYDPTPTPQAGQTVAVSTRSVERLATLDAYAGLADQVHRDSQLIEAVYRADPNRSLGNQSTGSIEVRGWSTIQTIPISAPLTLLRFAPDGKALLEVERVPSGGEQVYLITEDRRRVPAMAVPGHIVRLSWRPDSSAVVLHSVQGERMTLTLVRLAPSLVAAVVADLPVVDYAGALVPLIWDDVGLLWIAPDQTGAPILWSAPLTSLIPERKGPMDARALTRLDDGMLRAVLVQGDSVVIGRYQGDLFIGETVVPGVPPGHDLMGLWQGNELLLQGNGRAWLLDVEEN